MNQWEPAPAPTKTEFDTLNSTVSSLSDQIASKQDVFLTKSISATSDSDGMIPLGISLTTYVPVAFAISSSSTSPTISYYFGAYSTSLYLMFKDKTGAKVTEKAISGTLYYMPI